MLNWAYALQFLGDVPLNSWGWTFEFLVMFL